MNTRLGKTEKTVIQNNSKLKKKVLASKAFYQKIIF